MPTPAFMHGNQAVAEGAIAAGCRFYAGYPITPSSEIAEILSERLPQVGGVFIQMEDEIASMAAIVGASLGGLKTATATSGPGFSLMQENLGFAVISEIPCVVINVQRVGPSTGLPTRAAQGDVMQARWGTHGDHPIIVLSPSSVQECFDLTVRAFNLAERFRTPVVLLSDAIVSALREKLVIPDAADIAIFNRTQPTVAPDDYKPYEFLHGDVAPLPRFGDGYRFHVTGLVHTELGYPTEDAEIISRWWEHMSSKIEDNLDVILDWEEIELDDAEVALVAYGGTARSAMHAVSLAREQGIKLGMIKIRTLWPFPEQVIRNLAGRVGTIIVPELNFGQIRLEVERLVAGRAAVRGINRADGIQISPEHILDVVRGLERVP
ncbi:MAG: 2-oxoacid:acceptor oxidoreductase subunit alpha [Anaerolineae bacterium]|nr:2-oxoacid:acceptor oxidoreductase subunit alpha [Anaerolineae bacterium]NUQ05664.1 2-oxoacid:acceptor oxidoreductase subunit alpha [Anaerolineae bacterium]